MLDQPLMYPSTKQKLLRLASDGTPRQVLDKAHVEQLMIPLPPRGQQTELAQRVIEVEQTKSAHLAALAQSNELLATLQHRAFNADL